MAIHVDLRFVHIEFELWALEEHLAMLEKSIVYLREQDRIRTEAGLTERGLAENEAEVQFAWQEHRDRVNHVLPRYLRGSFLTTLWAVFEAATQEIADFLRGQAGVELVLRDIRGDFLDRAEKYFRHVLARDFMPDRSTADVLERILLLRNAYAHANGRLDAVKSQDRAPIDKLIARNIGINEEHGYLLMSEEFVRQCLSAVRDVLSFLMMK